MMFSLLRRRRYSGRCRPAWRMNHTGVYGTGSHRQAAINGGSAATCSRYQSAVACPPATLSSRPHPPATPATSRPHPPATPATKGGPPAGPRSPAVRGSCLAANVRNRPKLPAGCAYVKLPQYMAHPDVPAEQAYLDRAYERLEAVRAQVERQLKEAYSERGGTFQSYTERDIRVRNSLSRLEQLELGHEALIFGRI